MAPFARMAIVMAVRRGLARAVIRDWDRTATYPHAPPPPMWPPRYQRYRCLPRTLAWPWSPLSPYRPACLAEGVHLYWCASLAVHRLTWLLGSPPGSGVLLCVLLFVYDVKSTGGGGQGSSVSAPRP